MIEGKRMMIENHHPKIPIYRQCELLGLARSSFYYAGRGDDSYNDFLMRLIDEEYTRHPFYGCPRMTVWLRFQGHNVNKKRVARLMKLMGLQAIAPGPHTSMKHPKQKIYPYLLNDIEVLRPDQVWATDITFIRLAQGFVYLVAILDWFSRRVLSWELSNTMDVSFCLSALERALELGNPDIFNTDQGSQFTSLDFTGLLEANDIKISMDGRGHFYDNIFVERLWRSVKYEEVYLKDYLSVTDARENIGAYFDFYNCERPHQSLDWKTPMKVYYD